MNQHQLAQVRAYPASTWRKLQSLTRYDIRKLAIRGSVVSWLIVLVAVAAALIYREVDGPTFRDQANEVLRLQETVTRLESLLGDSEGLVQAHVAAEIQERLDEESDSERRIVDVRDELNNFLLNEIAKIRVDELRVNLQGQVGVWGSQTDFDGNGTWTLDGPGAQRQPDDSLAFSPGLWELTQSLTTITPLNSEARNFWMSYYPGRRSSQSQI